MSRLGADQHLQTDSGTAWLRVPPVRLPSLHLGGCAGGCVQDATGHCKWNGISTQVFISSCDHVELLSSPSFIAYQVVTFEVTRALVRSRGAHGPASLPQVDLTYCTSSNNTAESQ